MMEVQDVAQRTVGIGWYEVGHWLGIGDPSAINNSPTVKGRQSQRWTKSSLGIEKKTKSKYQTNLKCTIHNKILCEVDCLTK